MPDFWAVHRAYMRKQIKRERRRARWPGLYQLARGMLRVLIFIGLTVGVTGTLLGLTALAVWSPYILGPVVGSVFFLLISYMAGAN